MDGFRCWWKKINPTQPDEKFRKAEFFVKFSGQSCYHTFGTHRVWRIVGIVLIENLIHHEFESCGLWQERWRRQKQRKMPVWADITKVLTGYYGFCYVGNQWIGIPGWLVCNACDAARGKIMKSQEVSLSTIKYIVVLLDYCSCYSKWIIFTFLCWSFLMPRSQILFNHATFY